MTTIGKRILIIEDDPSFSRAINHIVEKEGYDVSTASNGMTGLRMVKENLPDLLILDVMLPGMDGLSVCRELKQCPETRAMPIIMISAKRDEADVVVGLKLGADDYMIKPFSYKELLARVKAALHRARRTATRDSTYENGSLSVDLEKHIVKVNGEHVFLTPLEYKLLAVLVEEAGQVVEHETLLRRVWGQQYENRRQYLKLYIWYLRQKIEEDPSNPKLILTERGIGYRLASS